MKFLIVQRYNMKKLLAWLRHESIESNSICMSYVIMVIFAFILVYWFVDSFIYLYTFLVCYSSIVLDWFECIAISIGVFWDHTFVKHWQGPIPLGGYNRFMLHWRGCLTTLRWCDESWPPMTNLLLCAWSSYVDCLIYLSRISIVTLVYMFLLLATIFGICSYLATIPLHVVCLLSFKIIVIDAWLWLGKT